MKYLIIIILFINCTLFPSQQSSASKKRDDISFLFMLCLEGPKHNRYTYIDNRDGTITRRREETGVCGVTLSSSISLTLKKCLQGQVYRQAQNDCKGTGTAADYYGAQKFQWCLTNDSACDDPASPSFSSTNPKISPAEKSCYDDTPLGKRHWSLLGAYFDDDSSPLSSYSERRDEIPVNDYIWLDDSSFATKSQAPAITFSDPKKTVLFAKNSYFYVLCIN